MSDRGYVIESPAAPPRMTMEKGTHAKKSSMGFLSIFTREQPQADQSGQAPITFDEKSPIMGKPLLENGSGLATILSPGPGGEEMFQSSEMEPQSMASTSALRSQASFKSSKKSQPSQFKRTSSRLHDY